ncbi:MAG: DMT family transporter [Rhodospirillaceae bacterium]
MELAIAGVVFLAAAIHPIRDLVLKGTVYPEAAYFGVIIVWIVLALGHGLYLGVDFAAVLGVLPAAMIGAAGLMLYYVGILTTMKTGDLSVYYPIIRAAPLFIVVGGWLVLGQTYGPTLLAGVALTMVGAIMLQYQPGHKLLAQPATFAPAALAMSGMGIQSLADSEAVRVAEPAALLVWQYTLLAFACMIFFAVRKPAGRPLAEHLFGGWRLTPWRYLLAAMTSYFSYYLILMSYHMGGNVVAVNGLRQISIPLSVVLGGLVLKELDTGKRFAWALVLAAGVVVIIVAR